MWSTWRPRKQSSNDFLNSALDSWLWSWPWPVFKHFSFQIGLGREVVSYLSWSLLFHINEAALGLGYSNWRSRPRESMTFGSWELYLFLWTQYIFPVFLKLVWCLSRWSWKTKCKTEVNLCGYARLMWECLYLLFRMDYPTFWSIDFGVNCSITQKW